ncbi:deoxyribonuclease V [Sulfurirhabdus autotrophica]|nr:deoxyribonuclease V [Sulfurirhabdus autotrophica]
MKIQARHPWNVTPQEAIAIQKALCAEIITSDALGQVHYVAGIDVGFEASNTITRAAIAILSFPELKLVDHVIARLPTQFPYVPGLLSFREVPAVLAAFEKLNIQPDLLLVDGQGIAHPRRFGIASHIGLLCDIPAIGVAKTRLIGEFSEVPNKRGAWSPLTYKGEIIGAVLRTRTDINPLYISPGHRISLQTAIHYVMACTTKFRLPETTRWAHRLASGKESDIQRALMKNATQKIFLQ